MRILQISLTLSLRNICGHRRLLPLQIYSRNIGHWTRVARSVVGHDPQVEIGHTGDDSEVQCLRAPRLPREHDGGPAEEEAGVVAQVGAGQAAQDAVDVGCKLTFEILNTLIFSTHIL